MRKPQRVRAILLLALTSVVASMALAAASPSGAGAPQATEEIAAARQALAPTGKLRVCLLAESPVSIVPGEAKNEQPKGPGFELGNELARRLAVPFEPVVFSGVEGSPIEYGGCDLGFLPRISTLAPALRLSQPFLFVEQGYLVRPGSGISDASDVDRAGVLIGYSHDPIAGVLRRTIKNARTPHVPGRNAASALSSGAIHVYAANKAILYRLAAKLPGSRVLAGSIGVDEISAALPKERDAGMPYVQAFLDDAKAKGLIQAAVRNAGLQGTVER